MSTELSTIIKVEPESLLIYTDANPCVPDKVLTKSNAGVNLTENRNKIHAVDTAKKRYKSKSNHTKKKPNLRTQELMFSLELLENLALNNPQNKWLICDICNYRTLKRKLILHHMSKLHKLPWINNCRQKLHCCEICGIRMADNNNLKMHMRIHTGEKPFPCLFESCDKRFYGTSERTVHMRSHNGDKPYKCDECPRGFPSKSHLNAHKRIRHSDARPYSCDQCNQTFKLGSSLKHHKLTHTDIRPFNCDICNRSFRQKCAYRVHMNIHTDNRPYICKKCGSGFHSASARCSHEKNVHRV